MTERGDMKSGDHRSLALTVIIINWKDESRTIECVSAIRRWSAIDPQVIVVDNESTARSRARLEEVLESPEIIFSSKNLGYAGGNNLAINHALGGTSPFILLLNSDATMSEQGVIALLNRMAVHPEISILGPVLYEGEGDRVKCLVGGRDIAQYSATRIEVSPEALSRVQGYPLHDVDYVSGTVFLARSNVFSQVGLLDEQYFFSGEIADFCRRARNDGHKVCVDLEVDASHDTGQTAAHRRETLYAYYSLRNRFLYIRKHYAGEKARHLMRWTTIGLSSLVKSVLTGRFGHARAVLLALMHGIFNRVGNRNASFE